MLAKLLHRSFVFGNFFSFGFLFFFFSLDFFDACFCSFSVIKKHWGLASRLVDEVREKNPAHEKYAQVSERIWSECFKLGEKVGFRNAQATVIAPTGTIAFLMDCDTTGIEPDFAVVKFKSCSGGGYLKIINRMVPRALLKLGYTHEQVADVFRYMAGTMSFDSDCPINRATLRGKGLSDAEIDRLTKAAANTSALQYCVNVWTLGEDALKRLGFAPEQYQSPNFNLLAELGFSREEIQRSSDVICGRFMMEGAPHVKPEHYNVFNCANPCGSGRQFIRPAAHIEMLGYAQRWISGAISKTVNLPNTATVEDIERVYIDAWKLGVKAIAVYRDGSKGVAPMSTGSKKSDASGESGKKPAEDSQELEKALERIRELEDQLKSRELELLDARAIDSRGKAAMAAMATVSDISPRSASDSGRSFIFSATARFTSPMSASAVMTSPVRDDILPVGSRSIPWPMCFVFAAASGTVSSIALSNTRK